MKEDGYTSRVGSFSALPSFFLLFLLQIMHRLSQFRPML